MQSRVLSERFERPGVRRRGVGAKSLLPAALTKRFYRAGRGRAPTAAVATGLFLTTSSAPATSSAAAAAPETGLNL